MKKRVLLSVVALSVALAAAAQNKAIDKLTAKYADEEGCTVINIEGDLVRELGKKAGGRGGEIDADYAESLTKISLVTIFIAKKPVPEFAEDLNKAVEAGKYAPLLSRVSEDEALKAMTADIKRGKNKKKKELIITLVEPKQIILVRIIGNVEVAALTNMMDTLVR